MLSDIENKEARKKEMGQTHRIILKAFGSWFYSNWWVFWGVAFWTLLPCQFVAACTPQTRIHIALATAAIVPSMLIAGASLSVEVIQNIRE
jgi:hypothetical protein